MNGGDSISSDVVQILNDYETDVKWFYENYESLKKKWKGYYVLVKGTQIKLTAKTIEELKEKAEKLGLDVATCVVKFIPKEDIVAII